MSSAEYDATPAEVRRYAVLQLVLVGGFLVLLFFMNGGDDADFSPWWAVAVQLVLIGVGTFLAERVWLTASPLPADADPAALRDQAVGIFAAQTVRKLLYCTAPLLFGVVLALVTDHGGWPVAVAGFPGLLVLTWEIWPTVRNTSMTAAMLDSRGADSQLVESFREA